MQTVADATNYEVVSGETWKRGKKGTDEGVRVEQKEIRVSARIRAGRSNEEIIANARRSSSAVELFIRDPDEG